MTERSFVWDGILTGDATIAPYSSAEWAELQRNLAGAGRNNYGVLSGTGNGTQVALEVQATSPASAGVRMFMGAALVNGHVYINDATLTLSISANASGSTRIDTVIIRRDTVAQTARAVVKQGTPSGTPVPATLQQDATTWEIPVAYVTVANGFTTIAQINIANCGQVINGAGQQYIDDVVNNSGGRLETGDIVIWDVTTAKAVTTTALRNDSLVAGVWVGSTANGGSGRVQIQGWGWVRFNPTTNDNVIGDGLVTEAAVKKCTMSKIFFWQTTYAIGRAMEVLPHATGTALILAYIEVQAHGAMFAIQQEINSLTPGGINSGAWVTRDLIGTGSTLMPGITTNAANDTISVAKGIPVRFHWRVPGYKVGTHSSRLFDTTASAGYDGTVERTLAASDIQTWSEGWASFGGDTFAGTEVFRIEQQVGTTNGTDGKGIAPAAWQSGTVPYTTVEVWRAWT
jgi:hypothetical protein